MIHLIHCRIKIRTLNFCRFVLTLKFSSSILMAVEGPVLMIPWPFWTVQKVQEVEFVGPKVVMLP